MAAFRTAVVEGELEVSRRLESFTLSIDQILAIARVARTWADDVSSLAPTNAAGTLAYIYGVTELRNQLVDGRWQVDRTCGVEAVINRELGIRIGYQNVDRACSITLPPHPRSAKGPASENLCGPTLFEYAGVDPGPLTGVGTDGIPTYYVMVGEDGSVELSHPVISNGTYKHFHERIFVSRPDDDWTDVMDPATGPIDDFDIEVKFKDAA
jgi:hypothetical protein